MTFGIIWARTVGGNRELVVASDSRLSGGELGRISDVIDRTQRLSWTLAVFRLAGVESNVIERRIRS